MDVRTLNAEVEKLESQWRWMCWLLVVLGISIIALPHVVLTFKDDLPYLYSNFNNLLHGGLGGAITGFTIGRWRGSKELKLLRQFKALHQSA